MSLASVRKEFSARVLNQGISVSARSKSVLKLFISYAHSDAGTIARRLAEDLRAMGLDVWLDLERATPGASWTRKIETGIDDADIVLALLSTGAFNSDICRAEQLRALRKKKRVVPILTEKNADVPVHLETGQYLRLYEGVYEDRLAQVHAAIQDTSITVLLQGRYERRYRTYPPLPQHFVPRPELLERVRQEIIQEGSGGISLCAIRGSGGIGKTVLAQALCHDEAVQDAFPDGVLWVNIGQNPSDEHLCEQIRELAKAMGDTLTAYDTLQGCQNQLRNTLHDKSVLIVLDDVWDPSNVQPFTADAPRCCLLLTTRSQAVVNGTNAREVAAGVMAETESKELLARKTGLNVASLPPEAVKIIQRCGGLPLALAMLGARAKKGGTEWARILDALDQGRAQRVSLKLSDYRYSDLFQSTQVSVDSLTNEQKAYYLDLAVFPANIPIPQRVLEIFWGVSEDETLDAIESWVDASLANYEQGLVTLHDLQHAYVRNQTLDAKALHRRLIDAYRELSQGEWANVPDDGYYFSHLFYHLRGAGALQDLRNLLLSAAWIRQKMDKRGVFALIGDYESASPEPNVLLIQQALQLSAHVLAQDPNQLASQLFGRLRSLMFQEIQEFLQEMRSTQKDPWFEPLSSTLWKPGAVLIFTLAGHQGAVKAVAMQADGKRALSASDDHTLRWWDLETGTELLTLRGHSAQVNAVVLSGDGKLAVSSSYDKRMKVWELERGKEVHTLVGHSQLIHALAITKDGKRAVSASYDTTLKVWDLASGTELYTLAGHSGWVNSVAITSDGKRAISASRDHVLNAWDLDTGLLLHTLAGHSGPVSHMALTPNEKEIVSASQDSTIMIWDIETGTHIRTLCGHTGAVNRVAVTADGKSVVSASQDKTIRIWDLKTGLQFRTLSGHPRPVKAVVLMPNGKQAISVSDDNNLKIWDLGRGTELGTVAAHSGPVSAVVTTPDGKRVISVNGSEDSTLKVWDFEIGADLHSEASHSQMVNAVAISPDGKFVVSGSDDMTLKVRDVGSDEQICTLAGHAHAINAVAITPNSKVAVSASADKTLKVWDLINGLEIHTLAGHSRSVDDVAIAPDGLRAISASCDGTLKLWNLENGEELRTFSGHSGWVDDVLITPDQTRVISASYDHSLRIWDLESGRELHMLSGHSGWVNALAFARNAQCVVSASYDNSLRLWDLDSGKPLHEMSGHSASVNAVAVTPDGQYAVSASRDHTLKVWDLAMGAEVRTLCGHKKSVIALALSGDGKHIISASNDNTIKLWTLQGEDIATFTADGSITCMGLHTDDRTIVAGDYLGRVHLLRLHNTSN
jgi:WD40 repeat protein